MRDYKKNYLIDERDRIHPNLRIDAQFYHYYKNNLLCFYFSWRFSFTNIQIKVMFEFC